MRKIDGFILRALFVNNNINENQSEYLGEIILCLGKLMICIMSSLPELFSYYLHNTQRAEVALIIYKLSNFQGIAHLSTSFYNLVVQQLLFSTAYWLSFPTILLG